jgi:predicted TIM-barrel fold metal-dependent hydrolase
MDQATLSDIQVIDVDTHVAEPYDLYTSRVSTKKWGDAVPRVEWDDALQEDVWIADGQVLGGAAASCSAGWPEEPPKHPKRLSDVDDALWKNDARLELMDTYGVHAQVLYANISLFVTGNFVGSDPKLAIELVRAYNDFLADYASIAPDRLLPVMSLPFWDLDESIAEMARAKDLGHRGVVFTNGPEYFGLPKLSAPHWDRLWATAQEMELPVNFHIASAGAGDSMQLLDESHGPAANYASIPVTFFLGNCRAIASLISGGICHRYPDLKFVSVESGVGWLPFLLDALDWMWVETGVTKEHPEYDLLPSEYFKRQIYGCFWFEHGYGLDAALARVGPDNLLFETDFPHPTSQSPGPVSSALPANRFIMEKLGHLGDDVLRKLLHDNAAGIYHLD